MGKAFRRMRCVPTVSRFLNSLTNVAQNFPTTFHLRSAQISSTGFSTGAYGGR